MERLLNTIPALLIAAVLAIVVDRLAYAEGMSLNVIRTDALRGAVIIFAAVACGSLLKRIR